MNAGYHMFQLHVNVMLLKVTGNVQGEINSI